MSAGLHRSASRPADLLAAARSPAVYLVYRGYRVYDPLFFPPEKPIGNPCHIYRQMRVIRDIRMRPEPESRGCPSLDFRFPHSSQTMENTCISMLPPHHAYMHHSLSGMSPWPRAWASTTVQNVTFGLGFQSHMCIHYSSYVYIRGHAI